MSNQITLPTDWETPTFTFGQEVIVSGREFPEEITGIKLDTIHEYDIPSYDVWMYRVGARWFQENSLSQPTPKMQQED